MSVGTEKEKEVLEKYGFEGEVWEENKDQFLFTGFPKPIKRYRIILEKYNQSVEEAYYWVFSQVNEFLGYPHIKKTIDTFAAAENSAFFGASQQRLGIQQDKVSAFLGTIGKMVKELFQIVRELRILRERLGYYMDSYGIDEKGEPNGKGPQEAAEITLKGIWIDQVQGGAKNPASVYGMAREVQFLSLPDLFFSTNPKNENDVDRIVDEERKQFNKTVRNVLKRQLKQYYQWKKETYTELRDRKKFTLKYLRQHYDIIKMYMQWVRPYIKYIQRLSLSDKNMDDPQIITAFESSMLEIEFLGYKLPVDIKKKSKVKTEEVHACILAHFNYRTRPAMSFSQDGYQNRGPIHVGKLEVDLRAYAWDLNTIKKYIEMKDEMDLELLNTISNSVKDAMDHLGGDLKDFLKEAGEKFPDDLKKEEEEKKKESKEPSLLEQIRIDLLGPKRKSSKPKATADAKKKAADKKSDYKTAAKAAGGDCFLVFKNFKKAHGLIMW